MERQERINKFEMNSRLDKINSAEVIVIPEQKDSIKIIKNTKGYNYEIKLVAKEGVSMLEQLDYVRKQMNKRINDWNSQQRPTRNKPTAETDKAVVDTILNSDERR